MLSQAQAAPANYVWDGSHVVYLPKSGVRKFQNSQIIDDRDANGNAAAFTYTTFAGGAGQYLTTVTDPVGRQTQYGYEAAYQVCTSWWFNDFVGTWQCNGLKWVYRVRTTTDPYGRSARHTPTTATASV